MKSFIALFFFFSCSLIAQDTIRFTNGELKSVKVTEVGLSEVKFNRFDLQDGPSYVVNKNDILLIKYFNGQIDSFKVSKQNPPVVLLEQINKSISVYEQVEYRKGTVFKDSKSLSQKKFVELINNHPDEAKRTQIMGLLGESNAHRAKQYQFGFIGAGLAFGTFFICTATGDVGAIAVGALLGTGVMISSQVISKINKGKRLKKLKEAVDLYNK